MSTFDSPKNTRQMADITSNETPRSELDVPGLTAWFDETDRALGDCLTRIESVTPKAVPQHSLRNELLFMLRAARMDLTMRYVDAIQSPDQSMPGNSTTFQ
jgi:hypothetical protein